MNTTRKIKNTRLQRPCREVLLIDDGAGDVGDAPVGEIPQVGVQDSAAFDYPAAVGGPLDGIVWPFDGNNSIPPQKRLFYGHLYNKSQIRHNLEHIVAVLLLLPEIPFICIIIFEKYQTV